MVAMAMVASCKMKIKQAIFFHVVKNNLTYLSFLYKTNKHNQQKRHQLVKQVTKVSSSLTFLLCQFNPLICIQKELLTLWLCLSSHPPVNHQEIFSPELSELCNEGQRPSRRQNKKVSSWNNLITLVAIISPHTLFKIITPNQQMLTLQYTELMSRKDWE